MLLTVGVLALSQGLANDGPERTEGNSLEMPVRNVDPVADAEMVTRLERLLTEQKLYLDPDLTLGRLSRRMGVPAKQLSAAINRSTGANVSRYVNGFRVENACERLMAGEAVTIAMLSRSRYLPANLRSGSSKTAPMGASRPSAPLPYRGRREW